MEAARTPSSEAAGTASSDEPQSGSSSEVIGRRIGAILIDGIAVFLPLFVVMALLFGESNTDGGFQLSLNGLPFIAFLLITLAYFFAMEAFNHGQTLGKRALGIRVVADSSGPASAGSVLARTLLRIIDVLPIFYLVGLVAVLASSDNKRLGDMTAGTRVVED